MDGRTDGQRRTDGWMDLSYLATQNNIRLEKMAMQNNVTATVIKIDRVCESDKNVFTVLHIKEKS